MAPDRNQPSSRERRLREVLHAFLKAEDAGRAPDRQEFIARHPELTAELTAFFADQDRLDQLAQSAGGNGAAASLDGAEPSTLLPGKAPALELGPGPHSLGDYELLEEIARGGMGVVYKARQRSLNRLVALKMILAGGLASPADVQRFKSEAEAAAHLDHPNIVPIYEVGEEAGQHYFSMKFVEGGSLAERLKALGSGASKEGQKSAARVMATVARAVHHAHQRGIMHRDLKPANILLAFSREPRVSPRASADAPPALTQGSRLNDMVPLVTDFGLAKHVTKDTGMTQPGMIVGTPSYMAPEQAACKKELTTAADVYSLGAILFELVTGQPPFQAETPIDTLLLVLDHEPPPPRSLNPHLARDLETIILKCLQKDSQKRYGSAEALAEDLERWLAGEPIRARPTTVWERGIKWAKRRPGVAAVTLGVAASLVLGLAGLVVGTLWRTANLLVHLNTNQRALYAAHMGLARDAWEHNDVSRVLELLELYQPQRGQEDVRGFEWRHLWRLCHADRLTLSGFRGSITAVAFSADGKVVAARDAEGVVKFWAATTGEERQSVNSPNLVSFAPDVRSKDNADLKERPGMAVAVSNDGNYQATAGPDQTVQLRDPASGQDLAKLKGHTAGVTALVFSPDSKTLATGSNDRTVKLWDLDRVRERDVLRLGARRVSDLAFVPKTFLLVAVLGPARPQGAGVVRQWNVATGDELKRLPDHLGGTAAVAISPGANGPIHAFAFSPNGRTLATKDSRRIGLWDDAREQPVLRLPDVSGSALAFAPDGRTLAVGDWEDAMVWLFDPATGAERKVLGGPPADGAGQDHPSVNSALAYSPDGKRLALACRSVPDWGRGQAKVFDAESGAEVLALRGHRGEIWSVAFSPDGKTLATGGEDHAVKLWDPVTGQERMTLRGHTARVTSVAFSADGTVLASGSDDGTIRLWRAVPAEE